MSMYDIIYEKLQNQIDDGELTLEDAEIINELAYDRYTFESSRLDKEYVKKQQQYQDMMQSFDNEINKQKQKIEKYKLILKKNFRGDTNFGHGPNINIMKKTIEDAEKKLHIAEQKKEAAKQSFNFRGYNKDIIMNNEEASLSRGRRLSKELEVMKRNKKNIDDPFSPINHDSSIEQHRMNSINSARDTKRKQLSPVGYSNENEPHYKQIKQKEPGRMLAFQNEIKNMN